MDLKEVSTKIKPINSSGCEGSGVESVDGRGDRSIAFKVGVEAGASGGMNACKGGDINMEAPILMDDLILAGGLGATDDIGSAFPGSVDFTDFEESLCYARGYEEDEEAKNGAGLGSTACEGASINTEAPVAMDDLIRSSGFGATDDIGSALPGSVDHTDTETALVFTHDIVDTRRNCADDPSLESSMTSDDVILAGGFGATDDMRSFLPVAVDFTDFEASLRDAMEYEEPHGERSRPGLGFSEKDAPDNC